MSFVDQQRQLPVLKQFLKLYTTISLPKLAGLMDTDEAAVKEQLRVLEVSLFPDADWSSASALRVRTGLHRTVNHVLPCN